MAKGKLTPPPPESDPVNRQLPEDPETEDTGTNEEEESEETD